ncbi:MAG TPA: hypothetical protein VLM05_16695, partial [Mycobacteriales bacterium]|nr:hypothetical protein [Mycobacteriales bacterium]
AASVLPGPGGGDGTPAASPSPTAAPAPVVPGISPAEAKDILARCYPGEPALQIFNAGPTPWGTRYLVYGPDSSGDCLHATEGDYRPGVLDQGPTRWLRGPLTVDRAIRDGQPYDRGPGTFTVQGRVVAGVTQVEIAVGASRLTVPVRNGTYMAAMTVSAHEVSQAGDARFRALDGTGRVVYASPAASRPRQVDTRCWAAPDGTVLRGDIPPEPGQACEPAVRWR